MDATNEDFRQELKKLLRQADELTFNVHFLSLNSSQEWSDELLILKEKTEKLSDDVEKIINEHEKACL